MTDLSPDVVPAITIAPADVGDVLDLRTSVLRPGWTDRALLVDGEQDPSTVRFAARLQDGTVVGTVTLLRDPAGAWQVRAMATDPAVRRRGIGARLLDAVVAEVALRGGGLLWCNARIEAVPFYASVGMHATGPLFDVADVGPHQRMSLAVRPT